MSKIRIFSLGGLNENGKNLYVVEVDKDIFVFDAGLKYDNDRSLGIDYIIPKFDYLVKNRKRIKGIFLTHGHESHIGAIPDIMDVLDDVDIYGTKLTLDIVKSDLSPDKQNSKHLIELKPHQKREFGKNSLFPISVTHSIPGAVCYVLYTPDGAIVYTGDFVFDATMTGLYKTDIGKLAYVGKQGVLCLMAESMYAEREGHTSPHNRVSSFIKEVFNKNENRIIVTILAAHFYRIQEIFDELQNTHRKVVIMGKKLQDTIYQAIESHYLNINPKIIGDLSNLNDKNVVVLVSDEKEKPFNNLERIIKGYDKYITLKETDTIFITEPAYEGIEKRLAVIMDDIAIAGCEAIVLSSKKHLLHHASREDLMLMMNLMNPKYYFPVKGEYRLQYANATIASDLGMNPKNILLKQNGDVVEFVRGKLNEKCFDHIEVDEVLIDGKSQGDIGSLVLKDREMLGENGIVIVCCTLDKQSKQIVGGPEILTRGFIYAKDNQELLEETKELAREVIDESIEPNSRRVDYTQIKNGVREKLGKFFYQKTESKPMVITVIQEV